MGIAAIIFDLDNTLIWTKQSDANAYVQVTRFIQKEIPSCDAESVVSHFRKLLQSAEKDPENKIPIDEWRTRLWKTALNSNQNEEFASRVYQLWKKLRLEGLYFDEEVKALLKQLRLKYKLLLLTNGDSQVQREKVAQIGAEDFFDEIVISGDHPEPKPHPSIFKTSCKLLGVEASQCIMVGDSQETDIQGGVNAKVLATVWINPYGKQPSSDYVKADYQIKSVLEVDSILQQLQPPL
ncbi:N-acylneuraminate-9-phosphatase-like [Lytechinus variegatus]|uniref:N-acylneuraminate-9-phosphatase-like n=1 Tax=Lytechinus variegatus TaxID=7654 RepID=UPI001BB10035|nr:N-acylneuraminate-9-phosphatase-like [Lytechinus variegatus]